VTRDYRVVTDLPAGLPLVAVDAASMTEVIYILLDNASKYAPPDTTITVRASADGQLQVRIVVNDEGPGIPEALRERVFEKFFRIPAREPQDPRRGGVGLGLPIARRLVDAQAGRMWIETGTGGRGTAVAVQLPVAAEIVDAEQTTPAMAVQ